jgi:hypothetical protein
LRHNFAHQRAEKAGIVIIHGPLACFVPHHHTASSSNDTSKEYIIGSAAT